MASWNNLPLDINAKIVKELDLLTRCRLKICSTANQKLVDSVPLTIKNARIGIGEERCLLMVHTGIGEFVKLNLECIKGKVVIKRSINSYDMSKAKKIEIDEPNAMFVLTICMKFLRTCPINNILLNVLEVEILQPLHDWTLMRLQGLLDIFKIQLRVKRLVFSMGIDLKCVWAIGRFCKVEDFSQMRQVVLVSDPDFGNPVGVIDTYMMKFLHGAPMCRSRIYFRCISYNVSPELVKATKENPQMYITYRCRYQDPKAWFEKIQAKVDCLTDKILVKRVIDGNVVYRHMLTPCGYSMTVIHKSMENTIDWKSETCGLGELCSKCKDRFEYRYFYDLALRAVDEKEWLTIFEKKDSEEEMNKFVELVEWGKSHADRANSKIQNQETEDSESESDCEDVTEDMSEASKLAFFFIWTLITVLITLVYSYFFPQLLQLLGILF